NDDVDLVWLLTAREGGALNLKATKRRQSWVPELVDIKREENPLRHVRAAESWPAGTLGTAERLDDLGADIDITHRKARELLKEAGHGVRNDVLSAALRWRRQDPNLAGNTLGNAQTFYS